MDASRTLPDAPKRSRRSPTLLEPLPEPSRCLGSGGSSDSKAAAAAHARGLQRRGVPGRSDALAATAAACRSRSAGEKASRPRPAVCVARSLSAQRLIWHWLTTTGQLQQSRSPAAVQSSGGEQGRAARLITIADCRLRFDASRANPSAPQARGAVGEAVRHAPLPLPPMRRCRRRAARCRDAPKRVALPRAACAAGALRGPRNSLELTLYSCAECAAAAAEPGVGQRQSARPASEPGVGTAAESNA